MTFIDQASDLLEGYIPFGRFPIFNSQNEKKHRYRSKKKPPRRASDAGGDDNKRVERIQLDYSYGSAILAKPYDPCGSSMTRFFARLAHPCANRDLSVRYNIRVVAIEKWFRRSITLFHSTVHS